MSIPPVDAPNGAYRERAIVPARTALLNVDMQNGGVQRRTSGAVPRDRHARVAEACLLRASCGCRDPEPGAPAGCGAHCRHRGDLHRHREPHPGWPRPQPGPQDLRPAFPKGSWGARVIEEVGPRGDEIIIPKTASGIFNATNIEYVLRNLGIEYLVIYGVVTDQCVESAIRDAADRGFLVTQVEDCCAADTPDNHATSIDSMRGHYCRTRTADELIAEFKL